MSDIAFMCPFCRNAQSAPSSAGGTVVRCIHCRSAVTVPPAQQTFAPQTPQQPFSAPFQQYAPQPMYAPPGVNPPPAYPPPGAYGSASPLMPTGRDPYAFNRPPAKKLLKWILAVGLPILAALISYMVYHLIATNKTTSRDIVGVWELQSVPRGGLELDIRSDGQLIFIRAGGADRLTARWSLQSFNRFHMSIPPGSWLANHFGASEVDWFIGSVGPNELRIKTKDGEELYRRK